MGQNSTKQLSFVVDEETVALINELKKELRAPTAAAVFRKALALTKLVAEEGKTTDGVVTVRGKSSNSGITVPLRA